MAHDQAGQRDALLFAAGELVDAVVDVVGEADVGEGLFTVGTAGAAAAGPGSDGFAQVAQGAEVLDQGVVLEEVAELVAAQPAGLAGA